MAGSASTSRWIRSLRPPKRSVDPAHPLGHSWEDERTLTGEVLPVLTIFLAGAECPFTCVFCDLWRDTLNGPTPPGAIPRQIERARRSAGSLPERAAVKLYNASSFFDPRAVPPQDDPGILELLEPFCRVTVECHPRFLGRRCLGFAEHLSGRLEVAIGLETVHPVALPRLNKGMTLEDFDSAAEFLRRAAIALRAFVLLAPPYVPPEDAVEWARRSAAHAVERGAEHVSLIPTRPGNGALDKLSEAGDFVPPTLEQLEQTVEGCLDLDGVVTADLWDVGRLATCECGPQRVERLSRMNLTGRREPRVRCMTCDGR